MTDAPQTFELVLASSSPRRRELLRQAGIPFRIVPPTVAEPKTTAGLISPRRQAEALAYFKASDVWRRVGEVYVLGADTLVAIGPSVLGKPSGEADARRMLRSLSRTRHEVITGVALLGPGGRRWVESEVTYVTMRPMSREEIDAYIASGEWIGKAGAYAIQDTAERFVECLEGSFSNVVGLPVERVKEMIRRVRGDLPSPPRAGDDHA